jgi:preprotein translocase SecF subunit
MSGPSAGVMALVALFHDVLLVFFVFVVLRIPLNESLVAVVLSILGFSINDTIVVYDRIRENERIYNGKMPLPDLVDLSVNQSLTRSINTSLCTLGAVAIAYVFATAYNIDSIKQFALPMMVGIVSGAYSTICLAGPLWVMWKTRSGRTGY